MCYPFVQGCQLISTNSGALSLITRIAFANCFNHEYTLLTTIMYICSLMLEGWHNEGLLIINFPVGSFQNYLFVDLFVC